MSTPIFPSLLGLGWPIQRTSRFSSNVQKTVGGKKTTIQLWTYPEYQWDIQFNLLRTDAAWMELQTMFGFFNQMAGQANIFLYQDQDDFQVTGQVFGTGDGATTGFQLVRAYGGYGEPIFAPNVVSNIYINGVIQAPSSYTVMPYGSANPGWVVFNQAPPLNATLSADFSFYFPCNFTTDDMTFEKFMLNRYHVKKMGFVSRK